MRCALNVTKTSLQKENCKNATGPGISDLDSLIRGKMTQITNCVVLNGNSA